MEVPVKKIIFRMITVVLLVACTKSIDNIQPDDPGSQDLSNTSDFRYQPEMNSTENSIIPKPTAEIFQENGLWGVRKSKDVLIPPVYDMIQPNPYNENYFLVALLDQNPAGGKKEFPQAKWGCADINGEIVIPVEYFRLYPGSQSIAAEKRTETYKKEGVGLLDYNNKILVPFEYDMISGFSNGRYIISKQNRYGVMDETGKEMIAPMYDRILEFGKNGYAIAFNHYKGICKNAKSDFQPSIPDFYLFQYSVINRDGEAVYQCPYIFKSKDASFAEKLELKKDGYPVIHIDESRCQKEVIEINGAYGTWGSVNFKTYQNGYDTFYWGEYAGFQPIESILWDEAMPIIYGEYPS